MARGLAWLFAALLLVLALRWSSHTVRVHSPLTGKAYLVRNEPSGNQAAADRLASLELRVRNFLDKAEAFAPGDPRLRNIRDRWDGTLAEIPDDGEVAHSIGKGAVSVCVRTDDVKDVDNSGMFVLLHELAHVATDSYGHTPEFWANMQFLLELAEAVGAYRYQDFESNDLEYCGRKLAGSPLDCVKRQSCESALPR